MRNKSDGRWANPVPPRTGWLLVSLAIAGSAWARAENCQPRWRLGAGDPGGAVNAMAQFNDGAGDAVFGAIAMPDGGHGFARFDGQDWSTLDSIDGRVHTMTVWDDGRGPALYVGGSFSQLNKRVARHIARWDGANWSNVGWGVSGGDVYALKSFDSKHGSSLIAAGSFRSTGGQAAHRVARWDGREWHTLDGGLMGGSGVYALEVFRVGATNRLCAAGRFSSAGGLNCENFATWDGDDWDAPDGLNGSVYALQTFRGPDGYHLFAGGQFRSAGGGSVAGLARWNGKRWTNVPGGFRGGVIRSLATMDDGNGPALYVGGDLWIEGLSELQHVARWDGLRMRPLHSGVDGTVFALLPFENGVEMTLCVGGDFQRAGRGFVNHFARWGCSLLPDVRGDLNCDGVLDLRDVDPFLLAMKEREKYAGAYADCTYRNGDLDNDAQLTVSDFSMLIEQLEESASLQE